MKNRFELFSIFEQLYKEIKTQYGVSIRSLRSDNAREYLSHQFQNFMASNGILHQTSCPYTPQQNGLGERKNRHFIENIRALFLHGNVLSLFGTTCFVHNLSLGLDKLSTRSLSVFFLVIIDPKKVIVATLLHYNDTLYRLMLLEMPKIQSIM